MPLPRDRKEVSGKMMFSAFLSNGQDLDLPDGPNSRQVVNARDERTTQMRNGTQDKDQHPRDIFPLPSSPWTGFV